ncbi:MAG: sensor histidine kinase, partial [Oceanobacter sp.]
TGLVSIAALWVQHNNETGLPLVIDWAWLTRNLLVAAILSAFLMRYFYVQSQWRLRSQAELKARLAALQARIRPHFFFNTLNTVASLIMIDPDKAENMLLDLAQLFRVVLQADAEPTLLETELELGRRYLDIEATRLGDRVVICWQLPASIPPIKLPILTLQPLLENAIYHGIQPLGYGGEILIQLNFEQSVWVLEVINDCPDNESSTRSGIAHENIRARLGAHFGSRSDLKTHRSGHKYLARLTMPPPEE